MERTQTSTGMPVWLLLKPDALHSDQEREILNQAALEISVRVAEYLTETEGSILVQHSKS